MTNRQLKGAEIKKIIAFLRKLRETGNISPSQKRFITLQLKQLEAILINSEPTAQHKSPNKPKKRKSSNGKREPKGKQRKPGKLTLSSWLRWLLLLYNLIN